MAEVGSKEWQDEPVFPNAGFRLADICPRLVESGTLAGFSYQFRRGAKELFTSSRRLCKRHDGLKSAAKAKKMGHGKKK